MDAVPARLLMISGPDEGKVFGLTSELVHIGTGPGNQVVLSDITLAEHQASIASRNGRFAIYVPPGQRVEVEGAPIPNDKWVWLPAAAAMRMGAATVCRFESSAQGVVNGAAAGAGQTLTVPTVKPGSTADPGAGSTDEGTPVPADGKKREGAGTKRKKAAAGRKSQSQVARFITDRPGDPLVKLGEDGQLPELALADAAARQAAEAPKEKNPLVLYAALTCSFVLSLGMLLLEPPGSNTASLTAKAAARQEIQEYFGREDGSLEPYQQALRQALIEAARGNSREERQYYRRVLQMLNAADVRDPANLNGLTGRYTGRGRKSDDDLRELLQQLLSN